MATIMYSVKWSETSKKFSVHEIINYTNQRESSIGSFDSFAAAYASASEQANAMRKRFDKVLLVSEAFCKESLRDSWGMNEKQKAELSETVVPKEQGRKASEAPNTEQDWEKIFGTIDFSLFSKEQQYELRRGINLDLPVQLYANPSYTPSEMARYRNMLETTLYARSHPNEHVIVTDYGPEDTSHGFKSESNFAKYPDSVCYVPENWDFEFDGPGYTARDIIEQCDGDRLKAEVVFGLCDWQHPSTILGEWDHDDDLALERMRSERYPQPPIASGPSPLSRLLNNAESRRLHQERVTASKASEPTR